MPTKRPSRRRGRAPHASESEDEEIVRVATSDSEESQDSLSASDESEEESNSEPVSRHLTPNTSHSPGADEKPPGAPFFAATPAAWADMVDDAAGLPVISFGELDAHAVRKVRMAEPVVPDSEDDEQPVASSSRHSPAPPPPPFVRSQSARQAYQNRLDSDPSFVPVVGEFWGHDDRLLDKDLRSLSGWWRGRWQGRGRGAVFPPRGRGRGGFVNGNPTPHLGDAEPASPMDRPWTHDGFEEMRRREDTRSRPPPPVHATPNLTLTPAWRATAQPPRGGAPMRGGARGTPGRTWFAMKPEHPWTKQHDAFLYLDPALKPRPGQPASLRVRLPGGTATLVRAAPRVPRPAKAVVPADTEEAEYVVRLPRAGKGRAIAPPPPSVPVQAKPKVQANGKAKAQAAADADAFTVKLPPAPASSSAPAPAPNPDPSSSLQPDADGWVRPDAAAAALAAAISSPPSLASPLTLALSPPAPAPHTLPPNGSGPPPGFYPAFAAPFPFPGPGPTNPIDPRFAPPGFPPPPHFGGHTPAPSLSYPQPGFPSTPPPGFGTPPPGFPQLGTPPPPGFGTPPAFVAPLPGGYPLPQGVALDPRGMPFELASGRPVYLPPQVYPYPHQHQHMAMGHGHSMSMGAMGMGMQQPDPSLFAFARPGRVRVEIRAPGASPRAVSSPLSPAKAKAGAELSPAGVEDAKTRLRTGAAAFVPGASVAVAQEYANEGDVEGGGGGGVRGHVRAGQGHVQYDAYGAYVPTQYFYPAYYANGQEGQAQAQEGYY
ncbi:hypothetical protein DFH07DRAFT_989181 [Mycena maculata]|uniref:Btz domain-containing protein n=1 Tax=Mycena maculata TaxID=230809 RepID=A0AAD7MVH2_9AGAR|nr:hypothetical protein DFH07DRAFT_989181 [Mycena maculata]